jgi:hypothetical protein
LTNGCVEVSLKILVSNFNLHCKANKTQMSPENPIDGGLSKPTVGEELKDSIGFDFQRLNRPSMEMAIAIYRRKKRNSNIQNELAQLGQVSRVRAKHLLQRC